MRVSIRCIRFLICPTLGHEREQSLIIINIHTYGSEADQRPQYKHTVTMMGYSRLLDQRTADTAAAAAADGDDDDDDDDAEEIH